MGKFYALIKAFPAVQIFFSNGKNQRSNLIHFLRPKGESGGGGGGGGGLQAP